MIQTNITARLECTTEELVSTLLLHNIEVVEGKVWNPVKKRYATVRGNPFIFVNKVDRQVIEVIYAGHKVKVLWFYIRPIGGATR